MAVTSPARLRDDLAVLMHQGKNVQNSSYDAARLLARTVKFDGFCMLTVDPATLLPTGEVVENGLPRPAQARLAEIEMSGTDFSS